MHFYKLNLLGVLLLIKISGESDRVRGSICDEKCWKLVFFIMYFLVSAEYEFVEVNAAKAKARVLSLYLLFMELPMILLFCPVHLHVVEKIL